jgi:hypothetical protein
VEGGRAGERARGRLKVCLASSPLFLFSSFVFFCFLGHIGWLAPAARSGGSPRVN